MDISEVLETAHISVSHATLKVAVDDLSKYKVLFEPRSTLIDDSDGIPVYEVDMNWYREMGAPWYVMDISPWFEDGTLLIHCEHPWDLKELADWLRTFEA